MQTEVPLGRALYWHTDVADEDSVRSTVDDLLGRYGRVDVLVNRAGWTVDRLFLEKAAPRVGVGDRSGFLGLHQSHPRRARLNGRTTKRRVVFIDWDAGRIGEWREAVYSGTKAGVIAMSKAIAKEVGRYGITLNVVCPGFTPGRPDASGTQSIWQGPQGAQFSQEVVEKVARSYPLRRLAVPEDVVGAVLFLASDRASYVTGQMLSVSSGYTMI